MTTPAHLASPCAGAGVCPHPQPEACPHAVALEPSAGRWYVTMGHPGFNTPANNRTGYATRDGARATVAGYSAARCRYCPRPRPHGYAVTCGGRACQEHDARDNAARAQLPRRRRQA